MKLSVCCPILNEVWFINMWLESVLSYADEIILLDGGSRDNTIQIIHNYCLKHKNIKLIVQSQTGKPYSNDWNECEVRNKLIDEASGDFILMLDADEMIADHFEKVKLESKHFYFFNFVPFWKDTNTIRVDTKKDPHWYGQRIGRLFPKGAGRYDNKKHHCQLKCALPIKNLSISLYHYHYAFETFGNSLKERDNRRAELGYPYSDSMSGDIDWDYGNKHPEIFGKDWKVVTKRFMGQHPKVVWKFVRGVAMAEKEAKK